MAIPVLIIGAGESGIAMGYHLTKNFGTIDYLIVDRQSGIGGTWWNNRYPGVACDVPTALYSFSFAPNYTSKRLYPTGEEFVKYLQDVAEQKNISSKIQLNTDVSGLRFIEEEAEWEVSLSRLVPGTGDLSERERQKLVSTKGRSSVYLSEETVRAKVVISCVGVLVEPNPWPSHISGRDTFRGEIIHSSRWPEKVDLTGKDVVVIGSGCSAAQIVPSLLKDSYQIKSLTQVMRSAPWVMPRLQEPFGEEKYARYAPTVYRYAPFLGYIFRVFLFVLVELIWATVFLMENVNWRKGLEDSCLKRMRELVLERYHEMMTPDYPYACKRRVFDEEWLRCMDDAKFPLTNRTLTAVQGDELVFRPPLRPETVEEEGNVGEESRIRADVIVLANGFEATKWLHPIAVYGRKGVSIHDVWKDRGGPQAYMGTAMDGFPNFFMICGPNSVSGHSSFILGTENTCGYLVKILRPVLQGKARYVEIKKEAVERWQQGLLRDMKNTVFESCTSWYMEENGHNSVMYPRSQTDFTIRATFPRYDDWIIQ